MPELPDVTLYVEALRPRVVGRTLKRLTMRGPFVLRTFDPPAEACEGRTVTEVARLGKRIVLGLEGNLFLVIHLMIAGRLRWYDGPHAPKGKFELAALAFDPPGTLVLTEAGTKKRAAIHIVGGRAEVQAMSRGGVEPLECTPADFAAALRRENRTLKRALTDPRLVSGIGNAYSDEILHTARLSPLRLTGAMKDEELAALHAAAVRCLAAWTQRLREQFGVVGGAFGRFPGAGDITAFRPDFSVHGRFGKPCPVCATPIQRIVHAENETNYCPRCQTGGRVLADRSLSRLLREDWPRTIEELE